MPDCRTSGHFQAKGFLTQALPHEFPSIVGRDFGGVVEAVGEGHTDLAVGDEVLGFIPVWPTVHLGTYAELIAVGPELAVVRKPAGLSFETAAAIPLAGATAIGVVDAVEVGPGAVLLVVGATGGVGSIAVQLAAQRGATVIATAKAGDEAAFVRSLGASETIDYSVANVAEAVRVRYPGGIDALIDLVDRNEALAALSSIVQDGGRISTTMNAADPLILLWPRGAGRRGTRPPQPAIRWPDTSDRTFLGRPAEAPGRRDLAKPQEGSPSTCGAGAFHILVH